jgi:hypothetical protein
LIGLEEQRMSNPEILQHSMPQLTCFGCGPANPQGLQLQSHWSDDGEFVVARFEPQPHLNAGVPNVMYGGTVASLIDCHAMWTAMAFAYRAEGRRIDSEPQILYVTGELTVKYHRPTPLDQAVFLKAWVDGGPERNAKVLVQLGPEGAVTAAGEVLAVRIDPGLFGAKK